MIKGNKGKIVLIIIYKFRYTCDDRTAYNGKWDWAVDFWIQISYH